MNSSNEILKGLENHYYYFMGLFDQACNEIQDELRLLTPVRTGFLKRRIKIFDRVKTPNYARACIGWRASDFGTHPFYALFVNEGTGIYVGRGPIRPKKAKFLRFRPWLGSSYSKSWISVREVKGQKPRGMIDAVLEKANESILNKMQTFVPVAATKVIL